MSKDKITISFSIPTKVKEMLEELAKLTFSSNTKLFVDVIRKEYNYWFNKKEEENKNE